MLCVSRMVPSAGNLNTGLRAEDFKVVKTASTVYTASPTVGAFARLRRYKEISLLGDTENGGKLD